MAGALAVLAFLLSPRVLASLGNAVGLSGAWVFLLLACVLVVHWVREIPPPAAPPQSAWYPQALEGAATALLFPFWAASLAGIAGYVFNEVYVSWFPNLGFSFLVLGAAGLCAASKHCGRLLTACGLIIVAATAILALAGVLYASPVPGAKPMSGPLAACSSLPAVLLGARLGGPWQARRSLVLAGAILTVWAGLFLAFVPPARLADSTVGHMVLARAVWGQTGRIVAGAMVIAACLGGMALIIRALAGRARDLFTKQRVTPELVFLLSVAGLVLVEAAALALGYAGEDITEDFISGSVAAWLAALSLGMPGLSRRSVAWGAALGLLTLAGLAIMASPRPLAALAYALVCGAIAGGSAVFRKRVAG